MRLMGLGGVDVSVAVHAHVLGHLHDASWSSFTTGTIHLPLNISYPLAHSVSSLIKISKDVYSNPLV